VSAFVPLNAPNPITQYAVSLLAWREEKYDPMGSAVLITPRLALTARHVVDDYWRTFDGRSIGADGHGNFACAILQEVGESKIFQHSIGKIWTAPWTDIALLLLDGSALNAEGGSLAGLTMTMLPPAIGEQVTAFGYPLSSARVFEESVLVNRRGTTTAGHVMELHLNGRDKATLPWPCFRTNARVDAGMSGGPVFTSKGHLCGLMTSGMPPFGSEEGYVSYVTLLWPMLGLMLDLPRENAPSGRYAAIELARANIIRALNWDRVKLAFDADGEVTTAALHL
jgi:S1-C subfamily serine protease